MVKLTPELIQLAAQYINPVRDRELDLRGYKIPMIENLGATLDQFDTIDFSDNDVRKLDGFPLLKRLKSLLLNNNRIVRIAENLEEVLPNLETLVLTGNHIQELADIDPLSTLPKLQSLSLMHCPVVTKTHYRLYVAFKIPQLRLLDFKKIRQKEREEANGLFKSKKGRELQREIAKKSKTFVPGSNLPDQNKAAKSGSATQEEVRKMREAIANATSLEEVERLSKLLMSGHFLGAKNPNEVNGKTHQMEQEEEEEEEDEEEGEAMET